MRTSGTRGWTTKPRVVAAAVLALATLGVGLYARAAALPAPLITSKPSNPSNQTSPTFKYSHASVVTFQCSIDGSAFSICGTGKSGTKAYSGLTAASHTFVVRAVRLSQTSAGTSYTWTIDRTNPSVVSIVRNGASPTNATSFSWTVTFSEPVTGLDPGDLRFVWGNTGIVVSLGSVNVTGSGAVYTVSINPILHVEIGAAESVGLNIVDDDSIRDLAGNPLGGPGSGNGSFTGQVYVIDRRAPVRPTITQHPANPATLRTSTFAWAHPEPGVTFRCSIDDSSWHTCTSPYTFKVRSLGGHVHEFEVVAVDAAGNVSWPAQYLWHVSDDEFEVNGSVSNLQPGVWLSIPVEIYNPNGFDLDVNQITVSVMSSPPGCPASTNIQLQQSPISSSNKVTVPKRSTRTLPPALQPRIQLKNLPVNQDACQNKEFKLLYGGKAKRS